MRNGYPGDICGRIDRVEIFSVKRAIFRTFAENRSEQRISEPTVEQRAEYAGEESAVSENLCHAIKRRTLSLFRREQKSADDHQNPVTEIRHDKPHEQGEEKGHHRVRIERAVSRNGIHIGNSLEVCHRALVFHKRGSELVARDDLCFDLARPRRFLDRRFHFFDLFRRHERFHNERFHSGVKRSVSVGFFYQIPEIIDIYLDFPRLFRMFCGAFRNA